MSRPTDLRMEGLERREVPTVFGNPWPNAPKLTLSFAADGVPVVPFQFVNQSQQSQLFNEMNGTMPTATWQFEVLKAFQTWAAPANINIGLVADNGTQFGSDGADFSMAAGGELRVGAMTLSNEVAAVSTPYHLLSGNRAGDVLLNTAQNYSVGGANGTRDLYSVMLNESANALGLDDNTDATSARYGRYTGVRRGISTADRDAIVRMYGARPNDALEGSTGNGTFSTARTLAAVNPPGQNNVFIATADGSITAGDIDTYRVTSRGDTNTLFVRLNTAGRSLFTGRVEVFNSAQQLVASQSITNPLQGDINFTVPAAANTNYFVRVTPARSDAFGVGTYRLQVGMNQDPRSFTPADPVAHTAFGNDNRADDNIGQHRTLTTTPGFAAGTRFTARGVLEGNGDRDMYAVTVPSTGKPMSLTLDPGKSFQMKPEVHVYSNTSYSWVQPNKLVQSEDGRWVAQFSGLAAGQTVYLNVRNVDGTSGSGGYELVADFNTASVAVRNLVQGSTTTADTLDQVRLSVPESTFFHFATEAWNDPRLGSGTHVQTTILNSGGQVVARFTAGNGMNSTQVFLPAGTYTLRFQGKDAWGNNVGGVWYSLRAARLSDPIDVYDPMDQAPQTPPVVVAPILSTPSTNDPWFLADPWSDLIA